MPTTYERIGTTTASGSTNAMTLSGLSQSYTHLRLVGMLAAASGTPTLNFTINNNTSAPYRNHYVACDSSSTVINNTTSSNTNQLNVSISQFTIPLISSGFQLFMVDIPYYTAPKTAIAGSYRYVGGASFCLHGMFSSSETNAVTRVDVICGGVNFAADSTFTAYGILKA